MAATIAVDVEKPMDGLLAKPVAPSWPADQVERRPVAQLIPYARNSRLHSEAQIAQIAASINEFGFAVPILVDEGGTIIAGHARAMAAARLGLGEVPVVVARGWSEAQKRAYVIADNKLTENGGWDEALLKIEIADLASLGFDVPLLGFSESELAGLTGSNPGLTDPDEMPEPPAVPVTQRGEVWQLGRHRLVCGDATCADDVVKVLAGVAPHLMVTDPPYGIDYDPAWRSKALKDGAKRAEGVVINDRTGRQRGNCFRATLRTAGMTVGMPAVRNVHLRRLDLRFVTRSFGQRAILQSAAGTITYSTSRAGTLYDKAKPVLGKVIDHSPPFGRLVISEMKQAIAPRSLSSA